MSSKPRADVAHLGDVVEINPRFGKDELDDTKLASFIPMKCVEEESGQFASHEDRKVGEVRKGYTSFRNGDIIFAKVTPCMENGKAAVVSGLTNGVGFGSTEFFVLRTSERIDPKYLLHFVLQQSFRKEAARNMTGAVGLRRVPKSWLEQQRIPLPPIAAQRQIVAEIEKQFTRLDAGVAALRRVQANLKRYRAAVLKAACEGRLVPTEAELAKAEGRRFETGDELLARILADRRKNWQGRGKYKEPAAPDTANLSALPEGWVWGTAEQLTGLITDGEHITPRRTASGVYLLSARNVLDGRISLETVDYVPQEEYERIARRLTIEPGDILLSCSGSVGRSTIVPEGLTFTLVRSVAVLKPMLAMGRYLSLALRSPLLRSQITNKQTQTAQANIFQGKIKTLCFPLPSLGEQTRIVAEVERRLSVIEELEAAVTANLARASRLRQSILQRAFSAEPSRRELSGLDARIQG